MKFFFNKPLVWLALLALLTLLGRSSSVAFSAMNSTDTTINAENVLMTAQITLNSGVLTVTDNDNSNDALEISYASPNYTITDTGGGTLNTSITGSSGDGSSSVTIPDSGVTGINFDVQGGDDSVTVNSLQAALSSGFTISAGTGTDSANINAAINTGAGNIDIAADTITLMGSADLDTTGAGTVMLIAEQDIELQSGSSITTAGGNVTLNSDSDAAGDGAIFVRGLINSDGGDITLGGGNDPTTNPAVASSGSGVLIRGTLNAAGGNISIRGKSSTINEAGVFFGEGSQTAAVRTTGAGTITVVGIGTNLAYGIQSRVAQIRCENGDLSISGTAANDGVFLGNGGKTTAEATGSGNVTITGSSTGTFSDGIQLSNDSTGRVNTGTLTVNATNTGTGTTNSLGLRFSNRGRLISTGSGAIVINAQADNADDFQAYTNSVIGDGTGVGFTGDATGDITINADEIDWSGTLEVESDGALTIQPRTASTTIGLGGGTGTLNLDDTELGFLQDGFSSITIGDATNGTGDVDIDSATFTDPVTIAGGTIKDNSDTDIAAATNAVTLDGNVAPGQSPGILNVTGNLALADNDTLTLEIGGTTPGEAAANHDQINVVGTVAIGSNVTLSASAVNSYVPADGDEIVIINNDGADAVSGTFNGLAEGATVTVGGEDMTLSYVGGDGNDVVLTLTATVIDLSFFSAEASDSDPSTVKVTWETAAEIDNAGFNLHRASSADGPYLQINNALIAATGQPDGGEAYSFMDTPGTGTFFYKLEDVDIHGNSSWHGPVSIELSVPTAVSLSELAQQEHSKPYGLVIGLTLLGLVALRKGLRLAQ